MRTKTWASLAQLLMGTFVLAASWFEYKHDPTVNPIFFSVFFLFMGVLFIDKVGLLITTYSDESEEIEMSKRFDRLPSLFAGRNDVVTFLNRADGLKYCIALAPLAITVKNTRLRYNENISQDLNGTKEHYNIWLEATWDSIKHNSCNWSEIVSARYDAETYANTVLEKTGTDAGRYYSVRFLDEKTSPMVQITIFELAHGKEIVFGWEIPGQPHGPCFLTANVKLIDYFESYFNHFWLLARTQEQQVALNQSTSS